MIDLEMNTAPLPSYLFAHKTISRDPETRWRFTIWFVNKWNVKLTGYQHAGWRVNVSSGYSLCQYCPVTLSLLGGGKFTFVYPTLINIHLLSCIDSFFFSPYICPSPNLWGKHNHTHESHFSRCSIHQYTLIRPCNDIHTWLRTLNFKGEKSPLRLLRSDMTVMQTTALKINSIPKLQWVIISVISIDQLCQVSILLVEQCRDTWHGAGDVSVCVCVCKWSSMETFSHMETLKKQIFNPLRRFKLKFVNQLCTFTSIGQ